MRLFLGHVLLELVHVNLVQINHSLTFILEIRKQLILHLCVLMARKGEMLPNGISKHEMTTGSMKSGY